MKKILFVLCLCLFAAVGLSAKNSYKDFKDNVTAGNLKYFARDLGGLMGGSTFTTGRVLGWGGFQVGPSANAWFKPNKSNTAMGGSDDGGLQLMPWIRADIGFPWRIDGFIRVSSFEGLTVSGGGFRWGIFRPAQNEWSFQTMVVLAGDAGVADSFSVGHYHGSLVLSMTMRHFTPYMAAGVDNTTVTVKDARVALDGESVSVWTPRYVAGLNFKLPYYLDLSLAGNWASYGPGAEASFTLRF